MATERLFGRNAILESLRAGRRQPRKLLIAESAQPDARIDEIVGRIRKLKLEIESVSRLTLDELVPPGGHQGVVLETTGYPYAQVALQTGSPNPESMILALDELEDPRNVGGLLRTAEASSVDGVVLTERRAASITPSVVNASSGAVEHLTVAVETNLARWLREAKASDIG